MDKIVLKSILLFVIAIVSVVNISCFSSNAGKTELINKSDIRLKHSLAKINPGDLVKLSAVCESDITKKQREKIERIGLSVNSIAGNIFTAEGTIEQIQRLAALPFILRLEGAKPVKLH